MRGICIIYVARGRLTNQFINHHQNEKNMENYLFIYSVDTVTQDGISESAIMIMDHEELYGIIRDAIGRMEIITRVTVTMYDMSGNEVSERDITRLVSSRLGS